MTTENPTISSAPREPDQVHSGSATVPRRRRNTSLSARGEPMVWLTGGAIVVCLLMIVGLLGFVLYQGLGTFWPLPLVEVRLTDGRVLLGEPTRFDTYVFNQEQPKGTPLTNKPGVVSYILATDEEAGTQRVRYYIDRTLYRVGNFDLTGERFRWVNKDTIESIHHPQWAMVIERIAWGNAYGMLESIEVDGQVTTGPAQAWEVFREIHPQMRQLVRQKRTLQQGEGAAISKAYDDIRLMLRGVARRHGENSEEYRQAEASVAEKRAELDRRTTELNRQIAVLDQQMNRARLVVRSAQGQIIPADRSRPDEPMLVSQIVHAYPANQLTFGQKVGVYLERWREYLFDEPREANTEGGVWPAIVGTVLLTFIMIIFVVPVGVVAALYLREYAKQGTLVSIVRISVNNLAGVPSIVYGVFGLGFFCYLLGGTIDQIFFQNRLPDPTVGKSAMIWASLTLALLTLPVVIVATEEALAAVPRSMREGSYACGASKWQTIRRIVLPRAMPGVMTGMILALARGAGEVAPLMLVGAVKLAPDLPISSDPSELFGLRRSFMHLGFHIYDLGFQSPDSEAARSMVYTTTLLLIFIVVVLNFTAIWIRSRLRRAFAGGQF